MMNQIQIWQLLVDIGLITSVIAMTVRAFKVSRLPTMLPKTRELEASLRNLIGEAEQAGLQLNDQLLRREQNIERALTEMREMESRFNKSIGDAEALNTKLQTTRTETIRVIQDIKLGFERGIRSEGSRGIDASDITPQELSASSSTSTVQSSQRSAAKPSVQHTEEVFHTEQFVEETYATTPAPRMAEPPHPTSSPGPGNLSRSLKTELAPGDLKRVYDSAEAMIKEGNSVEHVASQMRLPVEGVKLLAQMIEIEREEDTRQQNQGTYATSDARLGALAAIRRQTSSL